MKRFFFRYAFIAILSISCSKEDDPTPILFEVEIDQDYLNDENDGWIFIHDENGKLLNQAQFENGESVQLSLKNSDKKVHVTLATVYEYLTSGNSSFYLESYLSAEISEKWILEERPLVQPCGESKGEANFSISGSDLGNLADAMISDNYFPSFPDYSLSTSSKIKFYTRDIRENCAENLFAYVLDRNRIPKYKFIDNITPGNYDLSLSEFNEFDKVVNVNLPSAGQAFLLVKSFDAGVSSYDGKGFITNWALSGNNGFSVTSIPVGYLNKYPKHSTQISVSYPTFGLSYLEVGAAPASIDLPISFNPILTNKTFDDYSFSANESFVFRKSSFSHTLASGASIYWVTYSASELNIKNPSELSKEFIAAYPELENKQLTHIRSSFYTHYKTLQQEIKEKFSGAAKPETYKYVSKDIF